LSALVTGKNIFREITGQNSRNWRDPSGVVFPKKDGRTLSAGPSLSHYPSIWIYPSSSRVFHRMARPRFRRPPPDAGAGCDRGRLSCGAGRFSGWL